MCRQVRTRDVCGFNADENQTPSKSVFKIGQDCGESGPTHTRIHTHRMKESRHSLEP